MRKGFSSFLLRILWEVSRWSGAKGYLVFWVFWIAVVILYLIAIVIFHKVVYGN